MRTIILLLILANVAFFYWASHYQSKEITFDDPITLQGLKPIKLLSEIQHNTNKSSKSASLAEEQVSLAGEAEETYINQKCFSLGPFAEEKKSNKVYEALFGSGIQANQRTVNERRPKSYWVYLAPHKSQRDAEKTVTFLKKNKITEFYIWLDPPQKYAVSLGLFKQLETAREKIAEVKKIGLKPEMEVRFDEITEYWVDFNHAGNQSQPKLIEKMLIKNDRMLILETKCL